MKWLLLSLLLAACDTAAAPAGNTELLLTVTFSRTDIDELRINGTALAQGRAFGPFDTMGSNVVTGCTISLLFDATDAGSTMVCVEARAAGVMAAKACGNFQIQANGLSTGTLDLMNAPQPPPDPMSCHDLDACCHNLPNDQQPGCQDVVQAGDLTACAALLTTLEQRNICH